MVVACIESELPNGLGLLVVPQPHLHRGHVSLWVRVGSRFESKETNGISHFLEHMLYRGTPRLRDAHAVNLAFENVGGYLHAVTHTDHGVFSVSFPPENLDAVVKLFSEVLLEPTFADIELEKGIVSEEILEDLDDEGRQINADNISRTLVYPDHPLGFTITGNHKRIKSFSEKLLRAHHARHYNASSSFLVIAGGIDPDRAKDVAFASFGGLARGVRPPSEPPAHAQKKPRIRLVPNTSSQTELRICFRAIAEAHPDRPALDLLMRVIDDGMSTRLYHRICDAQGLCYDVSAGYDGYEDDGILDFAAGVQHSRTAKVTKEILDLVSELAKDGPTDDELDKAKRRIGWETRALPDSPEEAATFFAQGKIFGRSDALEERLERLLAVTKDDVIRLVRSIATPDRLNVVAVGSLSDAESKRLSGVVRSWK